MVKSPKRKPKTKGAFWMKKYFLILIAITIAFSLMAKDPNGRFERRDLNPSFTEKKPK